MRCLPAFDSVDCQRQNSSLGMAGAGRGNGEPHETFNPFLAPVGRTTMYMSPEKRAVSMHAIWPLALVPASCIAVMQPDQAAIR